MTVKELIEQLSNQPSIQDFEVEAGIFEKDKSEWGATLQQFEVDGINDIGYSEKHLILSLKRID